jgi:hypothetical protein
MCANCLCSDEPQFSQALPQGSSLVAHKSEFPFNPFHPLNHSSDTFHQNYPFRVVHPALVQFIFASNI